MSELITAVTHMVQLPNNLKEWGALLALGVIIAIMIRARIRLRQVEDTYNLSADAPLSKYKDVA